MRAYRSLEDAEWTRTKFVFLELGDFVLAVLGVSKCLGGVGDIGGDKKEWGRVT